MKSWQNSLKFSISQLNQNDGAMKLFNPSVVWQGSVVFGEVIFFSYFSLFLLFVLHLLFKSLFIKTMHSLINVLLLLFSFQGQARTELPGFCLCFERSKKKMEPSSRSSQCQQKRFWHLFIVLIAK